MSASKYSSPSTPSDSPLPGCWHVPFLPTLLRVRLGAAEDLQLLILSSPNSASLQGLFNFMFQKEETQALSGFHSGKKIKGLWSLSLYDKIITVLLAKAGQSRLLQNRGEMPGTSKPSGSREI